MSNIRTIQLVAPGRFGMGVTVQTNFEPAELLVPRCEKSALTPFEHRVLEMLAAGMTRRQIAGALHIAPATVSHCMTCAKEKLGARTPIEAVVLFVCRPRP